jgi:dipeptidyl aminopeptidase/acylaminoacyl peptidase
VTFITHNGGYNFESMYGTTEEVWFDEWDHGGTPWDKPEGYRQYFTDEGHIITKPGNSELWHQTAFDWLADYLRPRTGG